MIWFLDGLSFKNDIELNGLKPLNIMDPDPVSRGAKRTRKFLFPRSALRFLSSGSRPRKTLPRRVAPCLISNRRVCRRLLPEIFTRAALDLGRPLTEAATSW